MSSSAGVRETRQFASEIKFLVPAEIGAGIREWARRHLTSDPHGAGPFGDEYHTTTIYFDSPDYDVLHRRGSFGRSKYRIRRYNGNAEVFLERKLRRPGMLTKRRTLTTLSALSNLEAGEIADWSGHWFHRRLLLRRLHPVCEIGYHRVARAGTSALGPIRLTLDERLSVCRADRVAFGEQQVSRAFNDGQMILELKYRAEVPALFKQLVEEFGLRPRPASKYRLGMETLDPRVAAARTDVTPAGTSTLGSAGA